MNKKQDHGEAIGNSEISGYESVSSLCDYKINQLCTDNKENRKSMVSFYENSPHALSQGVYENYDVPTHM